MFHKRVKVLLDPTDSVVILVDVIETWTVLFLANSQCFCIMRLHTFSHVASFMCHYGQDISILH